MNTPPVDPVAVTEDRAALAAQLASARQLYMTFDPDSPPWAIEGEMERLERRLAELGGNPPTDRPESGAQSIERS